MSLDSFVSSFGRLLQKTGGDLQHAVPSGQDAPVAAEKPSRAWLYAGGAVLVVAAAAVALSSTGRRKNPVEEKILSFPEGKMSLRAWVLNHADRVESYQPTWESLADRKKMNKLEGEDHQHYVESLKKRARTMKYRAWKGQTAYDIPKAVYDEAAEFGASEAQSIDRGRKWFQRLSQDDKLRLSDELNEGHVEWSSWMKHHPPRDFIQGVKLAYDEWVDAG